MCYSSQCLKKRLKATPTLLGTWVISGVAPMPPSSAIATVTVINSNRPRCRMNSYILKGCRTVKSLRIRLWSPWWCCQRLSCDRTQPRWVPFGNQARVCSRRSTQIYSGRQSLRRILASLPLSSLLPRQSSTKHGIRKTSDRFDSG